MQKNKLAETIFTFSRLIKDNLASNKDLTHLTMLQMQTLVFLKRNPSSQMGEIAEYFKIELPSATSLINNLVKMNLVERVEDAKDRRKVRIFINTKGKKLLENAVKLKNKKLEKLLSYLSEEDRGHLLRIMEKLFAKIKLNEK